jgi:alpha-glucoside transport system substrate-binding protein
MPIQRKVRAALLSSAALALTLGFTATSASAQQVNLDPSLVSAAVAKAKQIAGDQKLSGSIEVIGQNGGYEGAITEAVMKPFETATGVRIKYTGTEDANIILARARAGHPPQVAMLQQGLMIGLVHDKKLVDLGAFMGDELKANFTPAINDTASVDGKVYGVYQGFSPFMLWYNPETYSGPKPGASWQDLVKWTEAEAAKGNPVWCMAQNAGAGSGFPGQQMIETLFAKKYGPKLLRQWGEGKLSWTSPQVKDAWQMFGAVATDKSVYGGIQGALAASIASGYDGLVTDPPGCQVADWAAWTAGLIQASTGKVEPGKNLDFMAIPASVPQYKDTEIFQAAVFVDFSKDPATEAFMKYLASDAEQTLLASANQWDVANLHVPVTAYKSILLQKAAKTYFGPGIDLSVGPNVLASQAVLTQFDKGVIDYMGDPSQLDAILQRIDAAAKATRK